MTKEAYDLHLKLILIGDSDVGKTSLFFRFSDGDFYPIRTYRGIDVKFKTVELAGKKIKLQIHDTAGLERYHHITPSYYRGAYGIMLVYDMTNQQSFDNISKWLRRIDEHANEGIEKMILGNKCDLEDKRAVSSECGVMVAKEHGLPFLETSAKANINVEEAFLQLVKGILDKMNKMPGQQNNLPGWEGVDMNRLADSKKGCC